MLSQQRAARFPRLTRLCLIAVPALAVAMVAGCEHSRTSYRPIFARPVRATVPCTNCGGTSATITTEEAAGAPVSTVPPLSGPSVESNVPPPSPSVQESSGGVPKSTVEPPPSAKIGPEPEYDEISPPSTRQRNSSAKPADKGALKPGPGPALQAPNTDGSASTWNPDNPRSQRIHAAAAQVDRRTAVGERLQSFVAGASASELFYPNKADRPWRYIVLHHSASATGNYDQIDQEHRKILGYDGCGYHFVIGNGTGSGDGQIEVAQRWNNQKPGVHCRNARSHNVDEYGIGICLIGDLDQQAPTPRQVAAARALISYLSQRYHIEPGHVATHSQLAATPTVCPGKYFPAQSILGVTRNTAQVGILRGNSDAGRLSHFTN